MPGRSPRADHDTPRPRVARRLEPEPPPAPSDPTTQWVALLVVPTKAVRADSQQSLAIHVGAPVDLDNQSVQIGAEARDGTKVWGNATWVGDQPSKGRVAAAMLGTSTLRLRPGLYRALVRVQTGRVEAPVLDAGAFVIA